MMNLTIVNFGEVGETKIQYKISQNQKYKS